MRNVKNQSYKLENVFIINVMINNIYGFCTLIATIKIQST